MSSDSHNSNVGLPLESKSHIFRPVMVNGLWVPALEIGRFTAKGVTEGVIDLDVAKVVEAVGYCKSRRRALDIGAHVGAVAVTLASRFERVEAFEPIKTTYDCLVRNAASHPNVRARNLAASDSKADLFFEFVPQHSQIAHSIHAGEAQHYEHAEGAIVGPVRALPLDKLGYDDVDFIKVDVEGAEFSVIQGLRKTIARCRPIIMIEQAKNDVRYHGGRPHQASKLLRKLGLQRVDEFPHHHDRLFRYPD